MPITRLAVICLALVGCYPGPDSPDDAGQRVDSGAPDAGGGSGGGGGNTAPTTVTVTFRYQYVRSWAGMCPGISPASTLTPERCSRFIEMTLVKFEALRLKYPGCYTSQTDSTSWTIDCTGDCSSQQTRCLMEATQTYQPRIIWACNQQLYATTSCAWAPP